MYELLRRSHEEMIEAQRYTDNLQTLEKELYPFWTQGVNNLIEKELRHTVMANRLKLFTDCFVKLKTVWYSYRKIEELDDRHMKLTHAC